MIREGLSVDFFHVFFNLDQLAGRDVLEKLPARGRQPGEEMKDLLVKHTAAWAVEASGKHTSPTNLA